MMVWLLCCGFTLLIMQTDAIAVMSVDLGSQFMKIAIVKPGVPMEIVLNKESRRKTPVALSMRDGERLFEEAAMATQIKKPTSAFWFFRDLLGKTMEHPDVKLFQQRFPYYQLEALPDTGLVAVRMNSDTLYSVEELVAMVLEYAKKLAEEYAEHPIKEAVVTVPAYFTQAERSALQRAVNLSGLHLLQLMGDSAAVALNYGVFRRKEFNSSAVYFLFYDVGAASTTATVVSYQVVQMKDGGFAEKNPQLSVKGIGFDRSLGGLAYQLRLRDHLAAAFKKQFKIDSLTPRAMAKLFKEAGRLKAVLSANPSHIAQIESLQDDHDFKLTVTRDEFEEMCKDLLARVAAPIKQALEAADIPMDIISGVVLMGGGTRMPRVQQIISETTGRAELGKSINTDEAAALGAVYQAAYLSKGFRVKRFGVKEANTYPIVVSFQRQRTEGKDDKTVTRTLFSRNNPFPQKKVMTFNRHTDDFTFNVSLGDLKFLTQPQLEAVEERQLETVGVSGVQAAFDKHKGEEPKGIKAHFAMDESGIVALDKVESLFETIVTEQPEEPSAFSRLGSTISNFFGGGSETEANPSTEEEKSNSSQTSDSGATNQTSDSQPKAEEVGETKEDKSEKQEKSKEEKGSDKSDKEKTSEGKSGPADNSTATNSTESANATNVAPKPKPVTKRVLLGTEVKRHGVPAPDADAVDASRKTLRKLRQLDEERMEKAKALNDVESFIVTTQERLYLEEYELASTEEERERYRVAMSEASDWMYELPDDAPPAVYKDKLSQLKSLTRDWFSRVREAQMLPEALAQMRDHLNHSTMFLQTIKNLSANTSMESPITQVEITSLEKLVNETTAWRDEQLKLQQNSPPHKKPVLTALDLASKGRDLDREIKYLLNKIKSYRPKAKPSNQTDSDTTTSTDSTADASEDTKQGDSGADPQESGSGSADSGSGSGSGSGADEKTADSEQSADGPEKPLDEPPTDSTTEAGTPSPADETSSSTTESSTPRQDL